jgi:hypothetical protein
MRRFWRWARSEEGKEAWVPIAMLVVTYAVMWLVFRGRP